MSHKKLRVIDLFAGCGGLSHGFELAGFDILLGIDNWDLSLETFKKNHKNSKVLLKDLSKTIPLSVTKLTGIKKIDVVIGGPPCQGFSISGKRIIDDPRNRLYKVFVDFVGYFRPKVFLMENVPNLLSMHKGKLKDEIIDDFENLGYNVSTSVLLASNYGVPQNRKRVFFVGVRGSKKFEFPNFTHGDVKNLINRITIKEAISDLPKNDLKDGVAYPKISESDYQRKMRKGSKGVFGHETIKHTDRTKKIISLVPDGGNYKDLPKHLQKTRKVSIAWTRFDSKKPSSTIDTGHNHHFHYKYNRVPTARESARIQSFEDTFIFSGKKNEQIKQIGNAVPPLLAEHIAKEIKKYI
ncbi:MAG: DNA cytosine methyltransferase [Candidatus Pacebacteria bacterium]|nr:DNA cytosine methyltransferase [Candidatus Paceibacterota bacterium]